MSKLHCGRCNEKVDVVTKEDYVLDSGRIFCNKDCFYNRFIPMDISKPVRKRNKHTKKPKAVLYILEDWEDVYELRNDLKEDNPHIGMNSIELPVGVLRDTKEFYYRYSKQYAITKIIAKVNMSDTQSRICKVLKDRSNGIII